MKPKKQKPYAPDPLSLRSRRQKRLERERRIKLLLTIAAILIIALIAVIFRRIALRQIGGPFKAPIENPTYWYEQTPHDLFSTITPTITLTPTATVPTATLTPTATFTPTISPTPTLTPTPKLRPRKTVEGNVSDLLLQAESTMIAKHYSHDTENTGASGSAWFEQLGALSRFDASEVYPNADCSWMGVAGVLIDKRGEPQIGYYIQLGFIDGSISETLSGLFPGYGDSGYELTIARPVQRLENFVWIQVFDQDHQPVSEKIYFRPSSECSRSLTIVNFQRVR